MKNKVKKFLLGASTLITYSLLKVEEVFSQGPQPIYGIYRPKPDAREILADLLSKFLIPISAVVVAIVFIIFKLSNKKKKKK